jgi:hypothetical protein
MGLLPADFESAASTGSATSAPPYSTGLRKELSTDRGLANVPAFPIQLFNEETLFVAPEQHDRDIVLAARFVRHGDQFGTGAFQLVRGGELLSDRFV